VGEGGEAPEEAAGFAALAVGGGGAAWGWGWGFLLMFIIALDMRGVRVKSVWGKSTLILGVSFKCDMLVARAAPVSPARISPPRALDLRGLRRGVSVPLGVVADGRTWSADVFSSGNNSAAAMVAGALWFCWYYGPRYMLRKLKNPK
jgi:hypothetical protein